MLARQNEFFQHNQGLIDDDTWDASEKAIKMALASNWSRNWWQEFSPHAFTEPCVNMVNNVLDDSDVNYAEIVENIESR
jgi:hypothetical protein